MKKFLYDSVFMYASLQFCGNIEEYFSKNTTKLVVFIVMPRLKNKGNLIRVYTLGKLQEERKVILSENIFLYYIKWLYYHWYILLKYFSFNESFFLISGHPITFFGLSVQRWVRKKSQHVYWIGDYFPGESLIIRTFELIKRHYHGSVKFRLYLSDGINKVFNKGKLVNTKFSKTIMWGVKPMKSSDKRPLGKFSILFVGLVKESQGLEEVFEILRNHKGYALNIVGICDGILYRKYKKVIRDYKISDQVFFPNRFFSEDELSRIARKSNLGIALYDTSNSNPTYYTDPGKVKTYTQLNLPVIMSETSGIASYIKKFKAGIVITKNGNVPSSIIQIKKNYRKYMYGVFAFNEYFHYETYYKEKFKFLESHAK